MTDRTSEPGSPSAGTLTHAADRRTARRATGAAFVGTTMEYYDFTLFGLAAATVFPTVFFAGASPFVATLASIATFSVAFVVRPFAGALLGSLGDRIGRRRVLILSMTIMGVATVAIGLIPGAATLGAAAPLLLLTMRVVQGVGASAEFSGATLVAVEFAPSQRRGLVGALPAAGNGIGGVIGTLVMLLVSSMLTDEQFLAWGWRIPFLLGGVILVYGLFLRARLPETPDFAPARDAGELSSSPLRDTLRTAPRPLVAVMLTVLARTGLAYFFLVFLVSYGATRAGLGPTEVLVANLVASIVYVVLTPAFGALADRVGRIPVILGGVVLVAILAFPLFALIGPGLPAGLMVAMTLGYGVAVAAMVAPVGRLVAELFPPANRYSAMGLANETGIAVGGAVVPPLAVYLAHLGGTGTSALSLLLLLLAVLGAGGLALLPRRPGGSEPDDAPRLADIP